MNTPHTIEEDIASIEAVTASINDRTREVGESELAIRGILTKMEEESRLREANAATTEATPALSARRQQNQTHYALRKSNSAFGTLAGTLVGATILAGFFYATEPENMADFLQEPARNFQTTVDDFTQDNFGFTLKP